MKKSVRNIIIYSVISILVLAAVIVLVVWLTKDRAKTKTTEVYVSSGTLYSTISSSGLVSEVEFDTPLPLALFLDNDNDGELDFDDIKDLENANFETNWASILLSETPKPIAWRVAKIGEGREEEKLDVTENTQPTEIMTLVPVYFDTQKFLEEYEKNHGTSSSENAINLLFYLLFEAPPSEVDIRIISKEFLREDEDHPVVIDTTTINSLFSTSIFSYMDIEYTISRITLREDDYLTQANSLFTVSYHQTFVSYTVSEYDYANIEGRIRRGERVYAAVSINALQGRTVLAEVKEMQKSNNISGVSYYTLLAKLVFAEEKIVSDDNKTEETPATFAQNEGGDASDTTTKTVEDYTYYDPELDDDYIKRLGIPGDDFIAPEEVLTGYTVTVTSQKEAVHNTLIVPTKCIYYDSANKPYVMLIDAEKKEKRVYIKVKLSTGIEAAIEAIEGYALKEGDAVKYTGDVSLLNSLF